MYPTKEIKKEIFKKHGKSEKNTGSPEGQIALMTYRVNELTEHLKKSPKDKSTQRSLLNLVGKRRHILDYLKSKHLDRYRAIIKELEIRK